MNVINNNDNNNDDDNNNNNIFRKTNYKSKHIYKTGRIRISEAVTKDQLEDKRNSERPSERLLDCNIGMEMGHESEVLERMVVVVIFAVTGQ
jgi:hypothetical protein